MALTAWRRSKFIEPVRPQKTRVQYRHTRNEHRQQQRESAEPQRESAESQAATRLYLFVHLRASGCFSDGGLPRILRLVRTELLYKALMRFGPR